VAGRARGFPSDVPAHSLDSERRIVLSGIDRAFDRDEERKLQPVEVLGARVPAPNP